MLYGEIGAACCQIHIEHINKLCWLETQFVIVALEVSTGIWNPQAAILNKQKRNVLHLTHITTVVKQYNSAHRFIVCVAIHNLYTPIKTILSMRPLFDVISFPTTVTVLVAP